jgi:CRP-like cAMP-binding protein
VLQPLLTYFDSYLALNDEERAQLSSRVVERRLKRRQFVLQQGDVCRHYTFVVSGCLKLYGVDKKGAEHILQFAAESDWISDIGSFYAEQPSQLYIEAIEPTVVLHFYRHYPQVQPQLSKAPSMCKPAKRYSFGVAPPRWA